MIRFGHLAAACGLLLGTFMVSEARAQEAGALPDSAPAAEQKTSPAAAPAAGPQVYLADSSGKVGVLDLGNGNVRVLGSAGVILTDIAFAPGNRLFGISFTHLYRVDPATGRATRIGRGLGVRGMNALACPSERQCLGYEFNRTTLYAIDTATGRARALGSNGRIVSAGDLVFFERKLYLSATGSPANSNGLFAQLNPANGQVIGTPVNHRTGDLWGLIASGNRRLFGFSNTTAYKFNPVTGGRTLVRNFGGQGLGKINGAAFNGYFNG